MNNYVVNVQHAAIRGALARCLHAYGQRASEGEGGAHGWIAV